MQGGTLSSQVVVHAWDLPGAVPHDSRGYMMTDEAVGSRRGGGVKHYIHLLHDGASPRRVRPTLARALKHIQLTPRHYCTCF